MPGPSLPVSSPLVLGVDNVSGALASAVAAIIVWGLNKWANAGVPTEIGMAISTVVYFAVCHFVPVNNPPST